MNRTFSNQQGEREADFINCVVWRKHAENVANFLKKGSLAGVDGRIQTRNYEGQDGKRVYVTEVLAESVQFLEAEAVAVQSSGGYREVKEAMIMAVAKMIESIWNNNSESKQSTKSNQAITRADDDPFANDGKTIDISDDDLPF